jgi:phosphatidylglycerol:prolipoprotein diacylglycerol transferase
VGLIDSPFDASLPVHPTQLYECAAVFAITAVLLLYVHGRKRYDGHVFFAFLGLYAIARFLLEFFRSDDRGAFLGLSTSQLISVALLAIAFAGHRWFLSRSELRLSATPALKSAG